MFHHLPIIFGYYLTQHIERYQLSECSILSYIGHKVKISQHVVDFEILNILESSVLSLWVVSWIWGKNHCISYKTRLLYAYTLPWFPYFNSFFPLSHLLTDLLWCHQWNKCNSWMQCQLSKIKHLHQNCKNNHLGNSDKTILNFWSNWSLLMC